MTTLDVARLRRPGTEPVRGAAVFDFSRRDFEGFTVPGPVRFEWEAAGTGGAVALRLWLRCELAAECVRCLTPYTEALDVEKRYKITLEELTGAYPEYPVAPGGGVDLEELAYGEVVLEAPILQLCRDDCPGLCQVCGRPRAQCTCACGGLESG